MLGPPIATVDWIEAQPGYCGITPDSEGDCATGDAGSWHALARRARSLKRCAALCEGCPRCHYVSLSLKNDDCSWFHSCALPLEQGTPGVANGNSYTTVQVRNLSAAVLNQQHFQARVKLQLWRALERRLDDELIALLHKVRCKTASYMQSSPCRSCRCSLLTRSSTASGGGALDWQHGQATTSLQPLRVPLFRRGCARATRLQPCCCLCL